MSAKSVILRVRKNSSTMKNTLPSTQSMRHFDNCCGIHGAARRRKGIKNGTSAARRRNDKKIIKSEINEIR